MGNQVNSTFESGRFNRASFGMPWRANVLQAREIRLCFANQGLEPGGVPRHAYLLSELPTCSSVQGLLRQLGSRHLLKLGGLLVSSMRIIWRWC
jgi:hypothetical protein